MDNLNKIKSTLKLFKDFPKKDIEFIDILNVFAEPEILDMTIDLFVDTLKNEHINIIAGVEARGFLIGPLIAYKLKCKFIPIRKKGKLPGKCIQQSYSLEYGEDCIEIQETAVKQNENVVIIDDLLATGGTLSAAIQLIKKTGAKVVKAITLIEIDSLRGREILSAPFQSFIHY